MRTRQTKAGPSALQGVRPRSNQSREDNRPRSVVPQLEELAASLADAQLQSVRAQVMPGDRVCLYRGERFVRVLLVGPERLHRVAPQRLAGGWSLIGTVEITEDGERALPVLVS
jgi:hypothetical protein